MIVCILPLLISIVKRMSKTRITLSADYRITTALFSNPVLKWFSLVAERDNISENRKKIFFFFEIESHLVLGHTYNFCPTAFILLLPYLVVRSKSFLKGC